MKLTKDILDLALSSDWKERFACEYLELTIRMAKLSDVLTNWESLRTKLSSSRQYHERQYHIMAAYHDILTERAVNEGIDLAQIHKKYLEDKGDI